MFDDLLRDLLKVCPNGSVEEVNGEIVFYTNLQVISSDGHLLELEKPE